MAVYPSSNNVFIRDHDATNKMVVDFARNLDKFPVNKYAQIVPVEKIAGYYLEMTIEEAGRIQNTDLREFVWHDSQPAPEGNDGRESFNFKPFETERYAYPFLLGDLTISQASWNILAQHASIKSRQAMTARTQLALGALTTSGNYSNAHQAIVSSGITGNSGTWVQSATTRQDIKRSLNWAFEKILDSTLAAVEQTDMMLVINSSLASALTLTQEIVDYIKGSPDALAQVRGELPGKNTMYGLPDHLYGFPIVVEATRKVTSKKGATRVVSQILPDATAIMCSRPGGLVGVADSPNFSTCCLFVQEEMTVESLRDESNRRTVGRVVENLVAKIVAPTSGFLFTGCQ